MKAFIPVLIFAVVVIAIVVTFVMLNPYIVLFGGSMQIVPLALLITIPLLLGLIIGFFMGRNSAKPKIKK
jgi:hypothetical protein